MRGLKEKGMEEANEDIIFEAYAKLRHKEQTAAGSTPAAKRLRNQTRKKHAADGSIKNKFAEGPRVGYLKNGQPRF